MHQDPLKNISLCESLTINESLTEFFKNNSIDQFLISVRETGVLNFTKSIKYHASNLFNLCFLLEV